jgi:hypothetical protein
MGTGIFKPADWLSKIYDCLDPVPPATAPLLANRFDGVARYLENLSVGERDAHWAAGLPILLMTTAPAAAAGTYSADLGNRLADGDDAHCVRLDVPPGGHLMLDNESVHDTAENDLAYLRARSARIVARRGAGGLLYHGADQPCSGVQIYVELPDVHAYWRAGSLGISEPPCEWCMWQIGPLDQVVEGHRIDGSCTGRDARGRAPLLWWPS